MYGWSATEQKIFSVNHSWVIYPFHHSSSWKAHHFQEDFWGKEQLSATEEEERNKVKRKKGGGLFLRHVALICSAAANENDDLQKVFVFFFTWLCIYPGKTHSWSHTLNKCNLYSIMNMTKKTDKTHGPSSHADLTNKTAGFHPWMDVPTNDQWEAHNLSPAYETNVTVWLQRTIKLFSQVNSINLTNLLKIEGPYWKR